MCNCIWRLFWWTFPADADVFRTSSGRLKKVTTSSRHLQMSSRLHIHFKLHNIWQKTSDLRRLEEVGFTFSWRRSIYDVFKTSDLWCLEDVWFTTSWKHRICVVWKTFNFRRFEDIWFTTSWRPLIYDILMTYLKRRLWRKRRLHNVKRNYFFLSCIVWNIQKILSVRLGWY